MPLAIFNYTERTVYEQAWTPVTRRCRGLIINTETGEVVARPFEKFFNYGEHGEAPLSLDEPVTITDKIDGSLGIMYRGTDGQLAIATRGSFTSEQALHATAVLRSRYAAQFGPWAADGELTHLFEIVYPANRVVVDYGTTDDLFYLGNVNIAAGREQDPAPGDGWPGPRADVFEGRTLADALSMKPRPNAEGLVVRYHRSGQRVKIKQADYVALHRILTATTARTVWEFLAVSACKHLITAPKHWGSRLGVDPARAAEILHAGDHWMDQLLAGVPDEFHAWLRETIDDLTSKVSRLENELAATFRAIHAACGNDRKAIAAAISKHEHSGAIFLLADGRDITAYLWKSVYPEPGHPFTSQPGDVA